MQPGKSVENLSDASNLIIRTNEQRGVYENKSCANRKEKLNM
jgi:hypothetical protein